MATIVKTSSGTWKALIRKAGWPPATAKTFRTKRDAEDWTLYRGRDGTVCGAHIQRAPARRVTVEATLTFHTTEICKLASVSNMTAAT